MSTVVVQAAQAVPLSLLTRFSAVMCEDSSTITLPDELADLWQSCGGTQAHTKAAVKVHTRWDLTRGRVWGPKLTCGRTSDRSSPFNGEQMAANTLSIADLGYFSLARFVARREAGSYTLSRLQAGTALFTPEGEALCLELVLPRQVGQLKELAVLVGTRKRHPMRLLLLRERWQMELLYKLWKQHAQVDEWHTRDPWRRSCAIPAGSLWRHWLVFAPCARPCG